MGCAKLILTCSKFVLPIQPQLSVRLVFRSHDCRTFFLPHCLPTITPSGQLLRSSRLPSSYSPFHFWHKWHYYPLCPLPQRYTKGKQIVHFLFLIIYFVDRVPFEASGITLFCSFHLYMVSGCHIGFSSLEL